MSRRRDGRSRLPAGQALIETLVALLVLLPLWFAVVYVARWHDVQHATIAAARHAAFAAHAAAGREDPQRISETTLRRLFVEGPGRFGAPVAAVPWMASRRPQWADHRGVDSLLSEDPGPQVTLAAVPQPEFVARAERQAFDLIAPARAVSGARFDLQRDAARGATVTVPLRHAASLPAPFAGLRFTLVERLRMLVDPWAARDPRQVALRTGALSPVDELRELMRPLEPVRWAVALFEPAVERLCFGRLEPDIVPPDRLVGGRAAPLDLRTRPC